MLGTQRIVVIGAGIGGLVSAMLAAAQGFDVTVVDMGARPGGKLREIVVDGHRIDAGPTVFTMRGVFESLFEAVGANLSDHLKLQRAGRLARHIFPDGSQIDLFNDPNMNAAAIGEFAGARDAQGYIEFADRAARIYSILENTFIQASKPNPFSLAGRIGWSRPNDILAISPFTTLWDSLCQHFTDSRLRQLFARYSTYCGSSPWSGPATLMLIAHVEREGVWYVEGGMIKLVEALAALARSMGARFKFETRIEQIDINAGRARAVVTEHGERLEAEAIIFAGDVSALPLLCDGATRCARPTPQNQRSLSALTFTGVGEVGGFPLIRHTIFFGRNYREEFDAVFRRGCLPSDPTVYVCASDREDDEGSGGGPERLFCLVNAPSESSRTLQEREIETCEMAALKLTRDCGMTLRWSKRVVTRPSDFARMFPATGGALYGRASHGWLATFLRPRARSRVPGLYLAGGSVHPGPGVPMAALSGRQAAQALIADLASTRLSTPGAMLGGTLTRSAKTDAAA